MAGIAFVVGSLLAIAPIMCVGRVMVMVEGGAAYLFRRLM